MAGLCFKFTVLCHAGLTLHMRYPAPSPRLRPLTFVALSLCFPSRLFVVPPSSSLVPSSAPYSLFPSSIRVQFFVPSSSSLFSSSSYPLLWSSCSRLLNFIPPSLPHFFSLLRSSFLPCYIFLLRSFFVILFIVHLSFLIPRLLSFLASGLVPSLSPYPRLPSSVCPGLASD